MPGVGYKGAAGFRVGKRSTSYSYPTTEALGNSGARVITAYDQIPLLEESLNRKFTFDMVQELDGRAGPEGSTLISKIPEGAITLEGTYLGLDRLIYCALGFEKASPASLTPEFTKSVLVDNTDAVGAGTTTARIYANTPQFFASASLVGEWLRVTLNNPGDDTQVRRITAVDGDFNYVDVSPAFTDMPLAGQPFEVARGFTHIFECAIGLYEEALVYGDQNYNRLRHGTLCIFDNELIREWQAVMVESMTIRGDQKQITFEFELLPFNLNLDSLVNTSTAAWDYSASPLKFQGRMLFSDLVMRIGNYSTSELVVNNQITISEFEITVRNNLIGQALDTKSGYFRTQPARQGFREVTGRFVLPRFESYDTYLFYLNAETFRKADLVFTGADFPVVSGFANKLSIFLPRIKFEQVDFPLSGPVPLRQTVNFRCFQPDITIAGFPVPSTGADNSEIFIKTQNCNPFNCVLEQNAEV